MICARKYRASLQTSATRSMRRWKSATAALDCLKKIEYPRATASGQIHQLALHTVGGVISNGETLMLIVPEKDKLIIEAQVEPQDIEHVLIGQQAVVRFVAFSDRNMKDSSGEVVVISPTWWRIKPRAAGFTASASRWIRQPIQMARS